ncbi:riboflavin synthase [Enterobacteriaceae endosymbiont of Donacia provostii]|uniref:riboflavin synthase n=1 Tax=Enterobacteriaceae endosymbiont of Donacia provostii TaxID=2675781 RepID=UPI0014494111|nr:riboflavin synthase [Enterobacteriaceae endosymbiont of Donacia provostii]QJC33599.1 riboflavin synthase [Enterobacteriaceae endosymbiont of Donacia provostii]
MFTGIVQSIGKIKKINFKKQIYCIYIQTDKNFIKNLKKGESISNNGCCLTIVHIYENIILFNVIKYTMNNTTFKFLKVGHYVNLEKPIKANNFFGGHIVLGHITDIAIITKIKNYSFSKVFWIKPNNVSQMKFIPIKGSICIDGVSLTIDKKTKNKFSVNLIPETLNNTTLSKKKIHNYVNLETDIYTRNIIQTIERLCNKNI